MDKFYLKHATNKDKDLLFSWANDPLCRANAFQTKPIPYTEHEVWFNRKMGSNTSDLFLYYQNTAPIGQLRFDYHENTAMISYSIAKEHRGFGYGSGILAAAETKILIVRPEITLLTAYVKKNNAASQHKFEQLHYQRSEHEDCFEYSKNPRNHECTE